MAHERILWQDRVVEKPRTFSVVNNPDGTITLIPEPGDIVQEGTPVNAGVMNRIEQALFDSYWQLEPLDNATTALIREAGQLVRVDESIGGVLRRRTELARVDGQLDHVNVTVYGPDGETVERQWVDTLVRVDGQLDHVEREVLV